MKSTEASTRIMPNKHCPSCGAELPENAHFCSHCGYTLKATTAIDGATKTGDLPATDVQPLDVSTTDSRISTFLHKVLGNLPIPMQHIIAAVLTRARDPKPELPPTSHARHQKAVGLQTLAWGWLPILTLTSTLGLLSVAYAFTGERNGATQVEVFFWLGLLLIFVPSVVRLISPTASRFERICLLCVVGICLYLVNRIYNPLSFSPYDEFLHWGTADDIARNAHLFNENALLPTSPFYPGMEIVTNALSTLSGLSTFYAGSVVIGAARLVMILSLFMLYERITKSPRMAGIATILYMTNPHFLFFDAQFAYKSLALPLAIFVLFTMARYETLKSQHHWIMLTACIALGAVVVTHHVTDFVLDGLLILWTGIYGFQRPASMLQSNLAKTALLGIFMSVAWISLKGNPVVEYLSSYFGIALNELGHVLIGTTSARPFFFDYSGSQPIPLWERMMVVSSVTLISLCLPFGLLCLWQRYRYNALACALGIASLFYPISQVFRLTSFGSEITGRAAAFLFIPIACVLAIFIVQFWPTRGLSWKQTSLITFAISIVFLGGVTSPPWLLLPGPYLVAADARSIEPEGIQAALWVPSHFGLKNRIATDRTNQLLMSAYGDQRIVTGLEDNIDVTLVFFSPSFGPNEVALLRRAQVRYLVVDLRLSKALPALGFYFEPGEPGSFQHTTPISLEALTKFSTIPQINRVFDSGDIVIYDVGGLSNAPEKP